MNNWKHTLGLCLLLLLSRSHHLKLTMATLRTKEYSEWLCVVRILTYSLYCFLPPLVSSPLQGLYLLWRMAEKSLLIVEPQETGYEINTTFKYPQRSYIAYRGSLRTFRSKIIFQIFKNLPSFPTHRYLSLASCFSTINNHLKTETPGIQNRKGKRESKGKLLLAQ